MDKDVFDSAIEAAAQVSGNTDLVTVSQEGEAVEGIEITEDLMRRAVEAHQVVVKSTFMQVRAIQHIKDERLYLALGYNSFKDYIQQAVGMSYRWAQELYNISKSWDEPGALFEDFGTKKLAILSKLTPEQRRKIAEGRAVIMPDGQEYTAEELRDSTVQEIREAVKEKNKEISTLKRELAEQKVHLEDQIKILNREIEGMEDGTLLRAKMQRVNELELELSHYTGSVPKDYDDKIRGVESQITGAMLEWQRLLDRQLPPAYRRWMARLQEDVENKLGTIGELILSTGRNED